VALLPPLRPRWAAREYLRHPRGALVGDSHLSGSHGGTTGSAPRAPRGAARRRGAHRHRIGASLAAAQPGGGGREAREGGARRSRPSPAPAPAHQTAAGIGAPPTGSETATIPDQTLASPSSPRLTPARPDRPRCAVGHSVQLFRLRPRLMGVHLWKMKEKPLKKSIRNVFAAASLASLIAVAGCGGQSAEFKTGANGSADSGEGENPDSGDESGGEDGNETAAGEPIGATWPDGENLVAEDVFPTLKSEDQKVRVGIEGIFVTDKTMELRMVFTPEENLD